MSLDRFSIFTIKVKNVLIFFMHSICHPVCAKLVVCRVLSMVRKYNSDSTQKHEVWNCVILRKWPFKFKKVIFYTFKKNTQLDYN